MGKLNLIIYALPSKWPPGGLTSASPRSSPMVTSEAASTSYKIANMPAWSGMLLTAPRRPAVLTRM